MVEKLVKEQFIDYNRITTLFYLSDQETVGKVLCDLTRSSEKNPNGYNPIQSYAADNCPLCQQSSTCIQIMGDQFLPENPRVTEYMIKKSDAPRWLNDFMRQFVGTGMIRCHYDEYGVDIHRPDQKRVIFLDVESLFENGFQKMEGTEPCRELFKRLSKTLEQSLPASLCRIVHLDDHTSYTLAKEIKDHFKKLLSIPATEEKGREIVIQSASKIRAFTPDNVRQTGTTLVVCGCMSTGRSLMAVSQSLRNLQTNGSIIFLVCFARPRNRAIFDEIRSNVTYGEFGPSDYGFYCIEPIIFVNDDTPRRYTPWDEEQNFLQKTENFSQYDDSVQREIEQRLAQIRAAVDTKGLSDNLFWANPDGKLSLRKNMAFFDFEYHGTRDVSQADVYFTIASVLHSLRDESQRSSPLVQHEHHRVVLSPRCFHRFNDGVIQAALLRAAEKAEIDYSVSPKHSEAMREVLELVFENWDNEYGEATVEFLLALAIRKLRLRAKDTLSVISELCHQSNLPPLMKFLCDSIQSTVLGVGSPLKLTLNQP